MHAGTTGRHLIGAAILLPLIALIAVTIAGAIEYFFLGEDAVFLLEKGALADRAWWRSSFYLHLASASLSLLCGPALFANGLLRRSLRLHKLIGWTYCVAVLAWAAPSGLVLGLAAKGGPLGRLGFALQAALWLLATGLGLRAILRRELAEHIAWMTRSYALALSAIHFRIFHIIFAALGCGNDLNYLASIWLGLAASLALGELGRPRLTWPKQVTPI